MKTIAMAALSELLDYPCFTKTDVRWILDWVERHGVGRDDEVYVGSDYVVDFDPDLLSRLQGGDGAPTITQVSRLADGSPPDAPSGAVPKTVCPEGAPVSEKTARGPQPDQVLEPDGQAGESPRAPQAAITPSAAVTSEPVAGGGAKPGPEDRTGLPWTAKEDAALLLGVRQYRPMREIAAELGRAMQAGYSRLRVLRELPDDQKAKTPGPKVSPSEPEQAQAGAAETKPPEEDRPVLTAEPVPATAPVSGGAARHEDGAVIWRKDMSLAEIERYLMSLDPHPFWTAELDDVLVGWICKGATIEQAAKQLGVSRDQALWRWRMLLPVAGLSNQQKLLSIVRARAAKAVA